MIAGTIVTAARRAVAARATTRVTRASCASTTSVETQVVPDALEALAPGVGVPGAAVAEAPVVRVAPVALAELEAMERPVVAGALAARRPARRVWLCVVEAV